MKLKKIDAIRSVVFCLSIVLGACSCFYRNNYNYKMVEEMSAKIEKEPLNYELYSMRASYYQSLANDINNKEMRAKSIADFLKVLELNKDNKDNYNANVYNDLAILFYMDVKEYEKAYFYSNEAIKMGHNDYSIRYIRGSSLCYLNRYKEAFDDYEYLIKNNRKEYIEYPRFWLEIGNVYYHNKRYSQAGEYLEYLIKLNPDQSYDVYANLAFIGMYLEDYDKAEKYAFISLKKDDNQGYLYVLMSIMYLIKDDKAKSENFIRKGVKKGLDVNLIWENEDLVKYFGKDKIQKMIDEEKK
ncbi:MAG TPA: tetratricopeptide repeat protein [Spirochaetota bacterium]|nr:tetratricopeptide repeat protein [Spirochaetota bacterium]HOR45800.1 tetratricopeptide repeat protein [Spirochaetota bacterium]